MKKSTLLLSAVTLLTFIQPVLAADKMADHMAMNHEQEAGSQSLYSKGMDMMHKAMMSVKPTGDADVDFVQGMIPHHEGAVEMAKTEMANGKDPEIRKLAADIIKAQDNEIAMMKKWLAKHKPANK